MQFTTIPSFFALLLALFSLANAIPIRLDKKDVFVPHIFYPTTGTKWKVGSKHHVKWDTSNAPQQITNPQGQLFLRQGDETQSTPFASDFDILAGEVVITVPEVVPGTYTVVLFGDSGNISNDFRITS